MSQYSLYKSSSTINKHKAIPALARALKPAFPCLSNALFFLWIDRFGAKKEGKKICGHDMANQVAARKIL